MKKIQWIVAIALILSLWSIVPVRADLTPGHRDVGFHPGDGADDEVLTVAVQADGKVLIGGDFTTVDGTARNRIARLDGEGALDTTFDPGSGADDLVRAVVVQPDGLILIAGNFTAVNGTARHRIARLNADGSLDTSFRPGSGADGAVRSVALQRDGRIIIGGEFDTIDGVTRDSIARLNPDGSLDTSFDPGTGTGMVEAVAVQPNGKVLIGGSFSAVGGVTRNRVARLNADGSLDTAFDPGSGPNNWVESLALQTDGKVIIGGAFSSVGFSTRHRIARLNADGSVDTTFDPGSGANAIVQAVAVQADGKVLVGGAFATIDGVARNRFARLNGDGSLDTGFDPGLGADNTVWDLVVQPDGKVLLGGDFTTVDGIWRPRIARVHVDGSLDTGFDAGSGASNPLRAVVVQPDGRVLVGGYFTTIDGTTRNRVARLRANGSLDTTFAPAGGANGYVQAIALQPDGKILIGGNFTVVNGLLRARIARLNVDGSLDTTFDPGSGADVMVYAVAVQPDGKVLIVGHFTSVDGTARNRIARLNADGSLDTTFDPGSGADNLVYDLALQPDGKVLIGGSFLTVDGVTRNFIARLNADGSLDTSFDPGTGASLTVRAVALQSHGEVLIGGHFTSVDGVTRHRIARLNADGSVDTSFDPGSGADDWVGAVAIQPNGEILIGGDFATVDGVTRNHIARLHADGSLDYYFDASSGADGAVYDAAIQPDGKVVIGGEFTSVDGVAHGNVARLNGATSPVITSGVPSSTAELGIPYSHTFYAKGYPLAPTFSVTAGDLPDGLVLNATTGLLSGTPTTEGSYTFTVSACNYVAPCDTQIVALTVEQVLQYVYLPLVLGNN